MKLSDVIKIYDIIHPTIQGVLDYCDFESAIAQVVGIEIDEEALNKAPNPVGSQPST